MSIVSIGSIRGTLGVAENQPLLNTPRLNVRSTEQDAPDGATATQPAGTAFAAPNQPWAPWPPYMPPPPEGPQADARPVVGPLPLPPDEGNSAGLVVSPFPPPVPDGPIVRGGRPVVEPNPVPKDEGDAASIVVSPMPPPVPDGPKVGGGRPVVGPLPLPPDEGANPFGITVSPLPLPPDMPVFAAPAPLAPFWQQVDRER